MTFGELSTAMINHFASRATQWCIRQSSIQLRKLEKESVADYSHNVRTHFARLNLPRSEQTHYFIQGLRTESCSTAGRSRRSREFRAVERVCFS